MNDASTCGDLIRDRQETADWPYRDLAEHSAKGFGLNEVRWRELRTDEAKTFSSKQLHGVATMLGASEHGAGRAALVTTGLTHMSGSGAARTANAVHADPPLTERDRRIITATLREMSAEERGGHSETTPMNQTDGDPAGTRQDPHTPSAGGGQIPETERGTGAPGSVANPDRMRKSARARGITPGPEGDDAPDWAAMAAYQQRTPGMVHRDAINAAGEESQAPDDDEDGGA